MLENLHWDTIRAPCLGECHRLKYMFYLGHGEVRIILRSLVVILVYHVRSYKSTDDRDWPICENQTPRKHVHTHTVEDENSCDKVKSSADELPENRSWEDVGSEMEDESGGSDSEAFTDVRTRKQRKAKKPIRIRSQPRIWRRSP